MKAAHCFAVLRTVNACSCVVAVQVASEKREGQDDVVSNASCASP